MATGIATEELVKRLDKLEAAQRRGEEERIGIPLRTRLLNQRADWVRRHLRRYLSIRQLLGGARALRFDDEPGEGSRRLWDVPEIELMHLCIDVELAIESLAWRREGREESVLSRAARELFIRVELEGESLTTAAHETGLSLAAARAAWEFGIETLWEALADYRGF